MSSAAILLLHSGLHADVYQPSVSPNNAVDLVVYDVLLIGTGKFYCIWKVEVITNQASKRGKFTE